MNFKLIGAFSLLISILAISGCNTIEGFGEDLERGGEEIQEAAD